MFQNSHSVSKAHNSHLIDHNRIDNGYSAMAFLQENSPKPGGKSAESISHFFERYQQGAVSDEELSNRAKNTLATIDKNLAKNGLTEQHLIDAFVEQSGCKPEQAAAVLQQVRHDSNALRIGMLSEDQRSNIAWAIVALEQLNGPLAKGYGLQLDEDQLLTSDKLTQERACGPRACYALINAKHILAPSDYDPEQHAQLTKNLLADCNPSLVGTSPANITTALTTVAAPRGYQVHAQKFSSATAEIAFLKENIPALVKLGSSLTSQHYTTITEFVTHGDRTYAKTSDGLLIPEKILADLVDQKPYPNQVWTLAKAPAQLAGLKLPAPQ